MLSITFITNCGYLINTGSHSILLDALYQLPEGREKGADGHLVPTPEILSQITKRQGIFSNVDRLLFTHLHWDHASEELAAQYAEQYGVPVVFPRENQPPFFFEDDDIKIESFLTTHDLMSNYDNKPHWCYRISTEEKIYLFTGDLDVHQPIPEELYQQPIHELFINVHHLLVPEGRHAIIERFCPEHLFVQHMPDPEHDIFTLHKRIHNKLNVYGDTLPPLTLLDVPMSKII